MSRKTVSEMSASVSPEMESLREENEELHGLLNDAKKDAGKVGEIILSVTRSVKACHPPKLVYVPSNKKTTQPCTLVAHISDWHIGQVTARERIEEFGEYNYALAESRMQSFLNSLLRWTDAHRSHYTVNDVVVLGTADWISGDIHQELQTTNEFPAPVQSVKAGYMLGSFLAGLAPHFATVRAEVDTLDNHSRLTKKPQCEAGGLNSYGYIVANIAKEFTRNINNIALSINTGSTAVCKVAGRRYLHGHGDGIMGTWGIPWYGIQRRIGREAEARLNMDEERRFHKLIIGHFHQPLFVRGWCVGGSLSGTTAYDHKEGRHCPPCQTAWFVHPTWGEFDETTFWL